MLPKSKRLTTATFKRVIEKGQSFHGPFFVVRKYIVSGPSRFAVSVPKKVAKTAVSRNKIKRQVYSAVKSMETNISSDVNVTIIAKVGADSFDDLVKEIEQVFVKSGIIK